MGRILSFLGLRLVEFLKLGGGTGGRFSFTHHGGVWAPMLDFLVLSLISPSVKVTYVH